MRKSGWMKMRWNLNAAIVTATLFAAIGCEQAEERYPLAVLGPYQVSDVVKDGKMVTDTSFTSVRPFEFYDQDSNRVTEKTFENKVYVADFFFTSCPTICPKMKQQMLRVQEEFQDEANLLILSHSIDPKRDSVGRLKSYADKLGVSSDKWHMVTGDRDSIYSMAKHYMIAAQEDRLAPGGFAHSGAFLLVDQKRMIRGIYDGTSADEVDDLMKDIAWLLEEQP